MTYRGDLTIIERLRETGPLPSLNRIVSDRKDAADEIERLRAALRQIAAVQPTSWTTRLAAETLNEQSTQKAKTAAALDELGKLDGETM